MLKRISLTIISLSTAFIVTGLTSESSNASSLVNGSFENHGTKINGKEIQNNKWGWIHEDNVEGWESTDHKDYVEIWDSGFQGVIAAEGERFAELNADSAGSLYQDVTGVGAGLEVGFEFYHRARKRTDVMSLMITDLGQDNIFGTLDDTILFFKDDYSATTAGWVHNTGKADLLTLGNTLRFAYGAVSTGSGNATVGNFLDDVSFGVGIGEARDVPEPASLLGLLAVGALGSLSMKRK